MIWDSFIQKKGVGTFSTHLCGKKNLEYGHNLTISRTKIILAGEIALERKIVVFFSKPSLYCTIEVSDTPHLRIKIQE